MTNRNARFDELLRTALPLIGVALVSAVCRLADRIFLGHSSHSALSAIEPAAILTNVFACCVVTTVSYTGILVARHYGGGRQWLALRTFGQGLWLTVFSFPVLALAIPVGNLVISCLGHSPALMQGERVYFNIVMPAQIFATLSAVLSGYLTAERQTKTVAVASIAGCLLNILLDPLLIFGYRSTIPAWGVRGAAIASAAATVLTALLLAAPIIRKVGRRPRVSVNLRFDTTLARRLLRLAVPNSVSNLIGSVAYYLFICAIARTGETALAISSICLCVNGFYSAILAGIQQSVSPLVGRCHGAGDAPAADRVVANALRFMGFAFATTVLVHLTKGGVAPRLFGLQDIPLASAAALAATLFAILVLNNLFETLQLVYTAALLGVGDTKFAMKSAVGVQLLFWLPAMGAILVIRPSPELIWLSMAAWRGIHVILLLTRWRSQKKNAFKRS